MTIIMPDLHAVDHFLNFYDYKQIINYQLSHVFIYYVCFGSLMIFLFMSFNISFFVVSSKQSRSVGFFSYSP